MGRSTRNIRAGLHWSRCLLFIRSQLVFGSREKEMVVARWSTTISFTFLGKELSIIDQYNDRLLPTVQLGSCRILNTSDFRTMRSDFGYFGAKAIVLQVSKTDRKTSSGKTQCDDHRWIGYRTFFS